MVRLGAAVFDRVLNDAIAALPEEFRAVLERVPVIVDPVPSREIRESTEDPDELLGLFVGPPVEEWETTDAPPEAAVIYLFHEPLEEAAATRAELTEQIRLTLLHELGHCLGFEEDDLDGLGLG